MEDIMTKIPEESSPLSHQVAHVSKTDARANELDEIVDDYVKLMETLFVEIDERVDLDERSVSDLTRVDPYETSSVFDWSDNESPHEETKQFWSRFSIRPLNAKNGLRALGKGLKRVLTMAKNLALLIPRALFSGLNRSQSSEPLPDFLKPGPEPKEKSSYRSDGSVEDYDKMLELIQAREDKTLTKKEQLFSIRARITALTQKKFFG